MGKFSWENGKKMGKNGKMDKNGKKKQNLLEI